MTAAESVLQGLDPEQRAAARAVRGPVCVLAGAGTGKTRAITHRIAYAVLTGVVPPTRVLAVTFTTRAAGEMRARLRQLGVDGAQARTFHAAALRQLTYFWPRVVGGTPPRVIESKLGLLAEAARSSGLTVGSAELRDLATEVEWAKVTQVRPDGYDAAVGKAGRHPPMPVADVTRVYAAYEELRRERNLLDFEAILELTAAMLAEHADVAREVRDQYRYFVVDEYQDVNPLQKLLLDAWAGGREDVCVVGDPGQTIYSFAGATPDYLLDFPREHPGATVVRLVRDYRSTRQVVGVANAIVAGSRFRAAGAPLAAQRGDGPEPTFREHPDELAEAADVASRARRLIESGLPAREMAVLFRVNAQSEAYEQAFADADIPYTVRGAARFFERPEVRKAVVLLRGEARAGEGGADAGLVSRVRHVLSAAGLTDRPPAGPGAARDRWESLSAIAGLAEEFAAGFGSRTPTLGDFVAELAARAAAQHAPPPEGVTLASLHAAKGLEWDAVFLVGLVEGTVPIVYADTAEQVEEERRLFYVGVTRARRHLSLSWALARAPGTSRRRQPSRFLAPLRPEAPATGTVRTRRPRPAAKPAPCRVCGRPLTSAVERKLGRCAGCPGDVDEALLDRLRVWRLRESREQRVPAFVVFTDATLSAIAERRPRSGRELLEIPGVGSVKASRYGAAVVGLCSERGR